MIIREQLGHNETEYEEFIKVFLYCDIRAKDYTEILQKYLKGKKEKYIYDMILYKLFQYYMFYSKSDQSDQMYSNMIADNIMRAKKLDPSKKPELLEEFKERKIQMEKEGDQE